MVEKSALVPYSAAQMYALVHDIESYPRFLPWCEATEVISVAGDQLCGRIAVARAGIHQSFVTCNRLVPDECIELQLQEGPFRHLHGIWQFLALRDDASKVSLRMEFEFSGRLVNLAFGPVFSHIADSLVEAFSKRAREVYSGR